MSDTSAIIVQCPSCEARFHLARERIPAKGARVRCSRCQHRFFVSPSGEVREASSDSSGSLSSPTSKPAAGGETAEVARARAPERPRAPEPAKKPVPTAPAQAQPLRSSSSNRELSASDLESGENTRSPWSMRAGPDPQEDRSLENPEFLFDGGNDAPAQDDESMLEAMRSSPSIRGEPGSMLGLDDEAEIPPPSRPKLSTPAPASASAASPSKGEPEIPDIRAQRDELAAQRAMAALQAVDGEDLDQLDTTLGESSASLVTRNDDWSEMTTTGAGSAPSGSTESDASSVGESEPSDPDPTSGYATARTSYVSSAGSSRVERVAAHAVRTPSNAGFEPAAAEPEASSQRLVGLLALAMGVLLLIGAARASYVGTWRVPPGPEQVVGAGWTASDVTVSHLRNASGATLLVIRGSLRGAGEVPAIEAVLVDRSGRPVSESHSGWPVRIEDARLRTDEPATLEAWARRAVHAGSVEGFTIVVPNPSDAARRFSLSLHK